MITATSCSILGNFPQDDHHLVIKWQMDQTLIELLVSLHTACKRDLEFFHKVFAIILCSLEAEFSTLKCADF